MGKTSKWFKSILTGKKDKEKEKFTNNINKNSSSDSVTDINPSTPITSILPSTPKEKRRWSFRRSSASSPAAASTAKESQHPTDSSVPTATQPAAVEDEQKKHAMAVAAATAAAADAAVAAAQAAAAVIRLTSTSGNGKPGLIDEIAAVKIQKVFRGYLARKALCALKGLVKLQALVRGHLVRKQAKATLRCMQALVTVQARARAQRLRLTPEEINQVNQRHTMHRKSTQENRIRPTYPDFDKGMEENIKIVEMDIGDSNQSSRNRNSYSNHSHYPSNGAFAKHEFNRDISPAPSALTEISPRASSGHFDEYSYSTAQSSPQYYSAISKPDPTQIPFAFPRPDYAESLSYDYPLYPNYMANTESSRAKARSQSAPKSRPVESFERQPSRRRTSMEGRNIPRAMRMQRSSSHVGASGQNNIQYPWSIKLDRSTVSLKESECGSTSTVLTNATYLRSLVAYDHHGNRY